MRLSLLIPFIVFFAGKTGAQYLFSSLQTKDGLSSNSVMSLLMDSDGYLWIGTVNGLNRFDGSSIKVYNWVNHNYPLSRSENILCIVELSPGCLLIGTTNGLVKFDFYKGKFEPIDFNPGTPEQDKDLYISDIVTDPKHQAWILSSRGLLIYKNDTIYPAIQIFESIRKLEMSNLPASILVLDTLRGGIWLNTQKGPMLVNYSTGMINANSTTSLTIPILQNKPALTLTIQPSNGDIWWSQGKNNLLHYSSGDSGIQPYLLPEKNYGILEPKALYVDSKDRVWYSSWTGKCFVIEPTGVLNEVPEKTKREYGLTSAFLIDIIEDKYGNLWFATLNGVSKLPASNVIHNLIDLPGDQSVINGFSKAEDGSILFSTNTGLIIYDKKHDEFESYIPDSKSPVTRVSVTIPIGDEWWCGTSGISIFNPKTKKFRQQEFYPYTEQIRQHAVTEMIRDRKGNIWFALWRGDVFRFDTASGITTRFDGSNPQQGDIGQANCLALMEDSRGRIWIGYQGKGLRVFDYASEQFKKITHDDQIDESVINQFTESEDGYVWASTWGKGLFKFSLDGEILEHINTQQGSISNFTSGVSIDSSGRIWFGTSESIHYFHPGALYVSKINYQIPIALGEDWPNILVDHQDVYVSLKDRVIVIDATKLDQQKLSEVPLISGISVFEEEIPFSPHEPDISLTYDQNFFSIEFSSVHHLEFPSLQYAYILDGFNPDWVNCGRRLSASFTNVPPGEYVFRVKNSDQDGTFHEGDRHFSVVIQPPFWKTTLFYILCAIIGMYLLFLLYRFIQRRREKKKSDQIIDYFANSFYGENAVNEICMDIARNCISQLGFEDCVVYLVENDREVLTQRAAFGAWNLTENGAINPIEIPIGQGIIGNVAKEGQAILVHDTVKDERYFHENNRSSSEITVPILHEQKVIGVIDSKYPRKNFFNDEHLKTLSTIASINSFKIADAQASMRERESALKLMEMNTLFAESQLKALRAQMNPHFVFNCLNSIQECIVMKKYGEASGYLNKFAKLFRLVLNNSGKLLITIDEEVEILTLYLELELMRFENSFQYTIHLDPDLETDDILMPSMFLQPFVENALWHGLMHKTGDRKLEITFDKISEDIFSCSIKDNGVGRRKSAELKKQKIFTHSYESKGMKMNIERLEVLSRQGFHASLQIIDMENQDGTPSGTNVIVEFSNNLVYK